MVICKDTPMSIRKVIEKNRGPIAVVAMVVIVAAIFWMMRSGLGGSAESDQSHRNIWLYDLNTGSLFASNGPAIAPTTAPSGGQGVYAHVYACGQCGDAAQRQVVYLSTHPDGNPAGRLVAAVDPSNPPNKSNPPTWFDEQSDEGIAVAELVSKLAQTCPDQTEPCYP